MIAGGRIQAYDNNTKQCYIPNNEIHSEWIYAIEDDPDYDKATEADVNITCNDNENILEQTIRQSFKF